MKTFLLFSLAIVVGCTAYGQGTPGSGSFGLGAAFSGQVGNNGATISNGLSGVYWVDSKVPLSAGLGLTSIADVATTFTIAFGGRYHFNKNQMSPFAGAVMFINIISPSGQGAKSTTQFGFILGGGAEYFVSKNFGLTITQGLQFSTEPSVFAFITRFGLEWFF